MSRKVTLAVCTLNQWANDFQGNYQRILQSIAESKIRGATFRTGPELEIPGYGCADHFFESDTFLHSWEVLSNLLQSPVCQDILIDVGMPVMHKNVAYNCRVIFFNKKILLIRPKMILCDNGSYRETRWFTAWVKKRVMVDHYVPRIIQAITNQKCVPFGDAVISTLDTCLGFEICEELWNPCSSHIKLSLDGAEIIVNSSGDYYEFKKSITVSELTKSATAKCGGIYMFSNLRGCDGDTVYYHGSSHIAMNGDIVAIGEQFILQDIEVITATLDLLDIQMYRNTMRSRNLVAAASSSYQRINVNFALCSESMLLPIHEPIELKHYTPQEEICLGSACWLWDYLRRSGQGGFLLPLNGNIGSSSCAAVVYSMCHLVCDSISKKDKIVLEDVQKVVEDPSYVPQNPQDLCNRILITCYMSTNSSLKEMQSYAKTLALQIGSYHIGVNIDTVVNAVTAVFTVITGLQPKFKIQGGNLREDLALQGIQARLRMVMSYMLAQLMLWTRGRSKSLLVLGTGNVDESLTGNFTKYGCSSADVNPVGSINKVDLKEFLKYASECFGLSVLVDILKASPDAEVVPLNLAAVAQVDKGINMTHNELNVCGTLRNPGRCGPYSMFCKLANCWCSQLSYEEIANKVKQFFQMYSLNRYKMSALNPCLHAGMYDPDDSRYDHRQILYNAKWDWQFNAIDVELQKFKQSQSFIDSPNLPKDIKG